jgi:hypothetical protein
VIDESASATVADSRLSSFIHKQSGLSPISLGDRGYIFERTQIVFIKGKFMFYVRGGVDLAIGEFSINKDFRIGERNC